LGERSAEPADPTDDDEKSKNFSGLVSDVEPELDDVAVLHDVFFAFDAELAGFAGLGVRADRVDRRP
jgi:hypothetical protein